MFIGSQSGSTQGISHFHPTTIIPNSSFLLLLCKKGWIAVEQKRKKIHSGRIGAPNYLANTVFGVFSHIWARIWVQQIWFQGIPEKILQNAVQTHWSKVNRTPQSKFMTKSHFFLISPTIGDGGAKNQLCAIWISKKKVFLWNTKKCWFVKVVHKGCWSCFKALK